ncbi:MAG TPA: hypothetical protein VGO93_23585 [Candidatus Xenobia bacterium]|jgi:hypothetical protein
MLAELLASRLGQSACLSVGRPPAFVLEWSYRVEVQTTSIGPDSPHRHRLHVELYGHLQETASGLIVSAPFQRAEGTIRGWEPSKDELRRACAECVEGTVAQLEAYCQAHPSKASDTADAIQAIR